MTILPARIMLSAAALAAVAFTQANAASIRLRPDEAASKDVLLYQFNVPGFFGIPTPPVTTNLDTETLNQIDPAPFPFGNFLGAAETDPFSLTPGGPLREHGTRSLLQFDLSGLGVAPTQVRRATLNLFTRDDLRFAFESPTVDNPVITDLRAVTEDWDEQTVTFADAPSVAAAPFTSITQSSVNGWVSFDITGLLIGWLNDPSSNFGVELSQREVVELAQPNGARDRYFASLYASSAFADPSLRPFIDVAPVPVPAPLGLLAAGVAALVALRRRRARA